MTYTIYTYDFTENGDEYKLCFYQSHDSPITAIDFVTLPPMTLLRDNELTNKKDMPQSLPFGMQLADTLKLKIDLYGHPYLDFLVDGYNKNETLVNGKFLRNNVWYLLRKHPTSIGYYYVDFYGFQQLKQSNKTTQETENQLLLDVELIGIHKFLLERVSLEDCLTNIAMLDVTKACENGTGYTAYKYTHDVDELQGIYIANGTELSKAEHAYPATIEKITTEFAEQLTDLGRDLTGNFSLNFTIEDTYLNHIEFSKLLTNGTTEAINPTENNKLFINTLVYDGILATAIYDNLVLGGAFSTHQENGLMEFENLANFLSKLCEQLVIRGEQNYAATTGDLIPYDISITFAKAYNTADYTSYTRDYFGIPEQEQGELLAKYNATKKEISDDDFEEIAIKNAGIFNDQSFEIQEVFNTNYNTIQTAGTLVYDLLDQQSWTIVNNGYLTRYIYCDDGTELSKVYDSVAIDIGDAIITDELTSIGTPSFYNTSNPTYNYRDNLETFVKDYNNFMIGRQLNGGLSYTALKAAKYILDLHFIVKVTTKLEGLFLGQVIEITDGLFKIAENTFIGSGKYMIVGIEKSYWNDTTLTLFRKA